MKRVRLEGKLKRGKTVYTCQNCGELFNWCSSSYWYGSESDLENKPAEIITICSEKCKKDFEV